MTEAWLSKRLIAVIIISSLAIMVGGALVYHFADIPPFAVNVSPAGEVTHLTAGAVPFALGVLMSMGLNIAKVFMLSSAAHKAASLSPEQSKDAANILRFRYIGRFALTAAVLVAAALIPFVDVLGAIFGIFSWHIAMYSARFSKKLKQQP
jgi:hypothetical protein